MRAASPLVAMPGGEPLNWRVSAKHPDESGCGAHECARHDGTPILSRILREQAPASVVSTLSPEKVPWANTNMKALLLTEYLHLELTSMPEPSVGPDGSTGRRVPPLVMGHEAAGEVAQTGTAVTDLRVGERVTFDSTIYCGRCFYCAAGQVNLCDDRVVLGVSPGTYRRHGAFAEWVSVPRRIVYRLPDTIGFEQAALIEAVSVAVHAVGLVPVLPWETAVVVGSGMIGLLAIQAARVAGCARVVAVDIDEGRLNLARQLGATEGLNSRSVNAADAVRELTGGRGAGVVLECLGTAETVRTAIACACKGGMVALVGNLAPAVELPLQDVVTRQIRLQGSCASSGEYPAVIELMSKGAIQVDPLISAVAPLAEGPAWFQRLYRREPGLMKVILQP
jgi:L-iditol 2-dehydrogenase